MNSGNPGIGLDLGFKVRINPDLTLSMSMIDLGKINWKTNLNSKNFAGEYRLHRSSVTSNINGGVEIITKKLGNYSISDSISNLFDLTYDRSAFSRSLPVTVYSGLQYQINPSLRISLVDKYVFIKDLNYNSFSITANFDLNKQLSVNTGYAIIGNSYNNIPIALLVRKDFGQIYIGTDNLLSFILPSVSDYAGFTFGTCFYLFRKRDLNKSISKYFPFYRPRKIRKNQGNGLLIKEYPES